MATETVVEKTVTKPRATRKGGKAKAKPVGAADAAAGEAAADSTPAKTPCAVRNVQPTCSNPVTQLKLRADENRALLADQL